MRTRGECRDYRPKGVAARSVAAAGERQVSAAVDRPFGTALAGQMTNEPARAGPGPRSRTGSDQPPKYPLRALTVDGRILDAEMQATPFTLRRGFDREHVLLTELVDDTGRRRQPSPSGCWRMTNRPPVHSARSRRSAVSERAASLRSLHHHALIDRGHRRHDVDRYVDGARESRHFRCRQAAARVDPVCQHHHRAMGRGAVRKAAGRGRGRVVQRRGPKGFEVRQSVPQPREVLCKALPLVKRRVEREQGGFVARPKLRQAPIRMPGAPWRSWVRCPCCRSCRPGWPA